MGLEREQRGGEGCRGEGVTKRRGEMEMGVGGNSTGGRGERQ